MRSPRPKFMSNCGSWYDDTPRRMIGTAAILISQFAWPGVPGSLVRKGGPPCARARTGKKRLAADRTRKRPSLERRHIGPRSVAPAPTTAAASAAGRAGGGRARRRLAVRWSGEHGKLEGVLRARA